MSLFAGVQNWLDERFHWAELIGPLKKKTVPIHKLSYWYFLGGITLFLFMIQVCTGILLLLYYRPGANEAFESVQYIMTRVQFGWLIRSIHSWAANLMILTAFAHMFSVVFLRAYRKPREMTWLSGMLLAFPCDGIRFQRVSTALEYAGIFRHKSGNGDHRSGSGHRSQHDGLFAGRGRSYRCNTHALLRISRCGFAGFDNPSGADSPGASSVFRHECPTRTGSRAGRPLPVRRGR